MSDADISLDHLDDILRNLGVDPALGLSEDDVQKRYAKEGPNEIPRHKPSFWEIYLRPMLNWLIIVWLINSAVLLILGNVLSSIFALAVISINAIVFIFQQVRAQVKLEALRKMAPYNSTVIRGGKKQVIPSREIVTGDVIELSQGTNVPADARILNASSLQLNEASLTGESVPVEKTSHDIDPGTGPLPLQQRDNTIYLGTDVASGHCQAVVVAIGVKTELGKISETMARTATPDIPLRKKINQFAKYIVIGVMIILAIKFTITIALVAQQHPAIPVSLDEFRTTLAQSIVSGFTLMPMNIPFLTTITLLVGVITMIKYNVFVQNISAVESLGRASVVCSDKTGTITKSEMTVRRIWCDRFLYTVTGEGYSPEGRIEDFAPDGTPSTPIDVSQTPALSQLIVAGFLNNTASLIQAKDAKISERTEKRKKQSKLAKDAIEWSVIGSPTEAALLLLFKKAHLDEMNIHEQYNEVFEYPFDSTLKRMTKVFRTGNQYMVSCKGATEFILSLSSQAILGGNVETLTEEDREEITRETQGFEGEGYRILSFAYKYLPEVPSEWNDARDIIESDLIFLGFVCIFDPPRAGVSKSIEECKDAGIKVIMVTGDSALTAQTIGQEVGIYKEGDRVIEGNQIETLTLEELSQATVFARVSPKHKETIISKLQEGEKNVIAMTGDGVNDALALHLADVGIAMGVKGTDVAKQAADIMLIDDSFTSIVDGIHEGRSLFTKIRTLVYFYVGINLMEAIVLFLFSFNPITNFQFLLPFQYYFLLLTSHNFTGFGIAFDKRDPDVMKQPPRDSEGILSKQLIGAMIIQAIMVGACVAFIYLLSSSGAIPILPDASGLFPRQNMVFDVTSGNFVMATIPQKAITMTMVTIIISEVLWAFSARRLNKSALGTIKKDLSFWFVILCLFAPAAAFLWPIAVSILPFVQTLLVHLGIDLQFVELGVRDWLACIGVALIGFAGFELWKWFLRRRNVHL